MEKKAPCCRRPKELKGKPQECTPGQIRKCHGDAKGHPCAPGEEKKRK